ncbi:hypothetical protein SBD_3453 [Streptomyces bottropensis ATCC 25435]|uniref:Uncharacterized protein n=1 Tax=Streptomyces bottropensis ATCC 25435 TaxID=1054862 RepID=M3FVA8_9ACTN|nr:hypothetical protein SBD_3453 [Streptomyces bottropensis ATCC 25435]
MLQHGPQHHAGTRPPPVAVGDARHGRGGERGRGRRRSEGRRAGRRGRESGSVQGGCCRGLGHDDHPRERVRHCAVSKGEACRSRLTRDGDRWPYPRVAGRRSDATRSTGPEQPCARS